MSRRSLNPQPPSPWTPAREALTVELWHAKVPVNEIARRLSAPGAPDVEKGPITKNSVCSKARRLGLPMRANPAGVRKASKPKPRWKPGMPIPPKKERTVALHPVEAEKVRKLPAALAGHAAGPVTRGWATDARRGADRGCQWIEGDAIGGVKCGLPVLGGKGAWCAEHRARVYLRMPREARG